MDIPDLLQKIEAAIDGNDVALARQLLKEALLTPTADIYFQASRVAVDASQKKQFLEKALQLDPFHKESANELAQLSQTSNSSFQSAPVLPAPPPIKKQSASIFSKPFMLLAGVIVLIIVAVIISNGSSNSSASYSPTSSYRSPTLKPYPTQTPTPAIQTYNITVARDVTTDILLYPGDQVTVNASGQIDTGTFWHYVATPDGIDQSGEFLLRSYDVDTDFRHGSLLYSFPDSNTLYFCGSHCSFSVTGAASAYLQFLINDNDQGNNSGSFELEVTVVRR